jgi:O-antigen/teichoic acid export membrane protein
VSSDAPSSLNAEPRAIARNAATGYVALAVGSLLGFVLTPILLHHLGASRFGIWSLIVASTGYLGLVEAGLGFATTNRFAALEADGPAALNSLLGTAFVLFAAVAVCVLLLTSAFSLVFPALFGVPSRFVADARIALLLVAGANAVSFLFVSFLSSLQGTGRMYIVNLAGCGLSLVTYGAMAALVLTGRGLVALAGVQLLNAVATLLVYRWAMRATMPALKVRLTAFDRAVVRQLLALGGRTSIFSVASTLAFGSDLVLVGLVLNFRAVAAYAIALRVYGFLQAITSGVLNVVGPSHAHAARHASSARRFELFRIVTFATLSLALCVALIVGVFASGLLGLWLGSVPHHAALVLSVLCAVLVLQTPGMSSASLLMNAERAGEIARLTVASAVLNVSASVILTLVVGISGPALGSLVAVTSIDATLMPLRASRALGVSYLSFLRCAVLPVLVPVGALGALLLCGRLLVARGPGVILVSLLGAAAFFATIWFQPLGSQIRQLLRRQPA